MNQKKSYTLIEVTESTGLDRLTILTWTERQWIRPVEIDSLDEEDLARLRLIIELQKDFVVNDEGIPIILHLMDQLYYLNHHIQRSSKS